MKLTVTELRSIVRKVIKEAIDDDQDEFNDAVDQLMKQPELKSIEAFAEMKFDDDQTTYDTLELQALARNLYLKDQHGKGQVYKGQLATAPATYRDKVKEELAGYGLTFVPRAKMKQVRGVTAPLNGSNRFAGNHGGSGFETEFNRTPSAGRTFDPNDKGALGMGSKKKRNEARFDKNNIEYYVIATKDAAGVETYLARDRVDPNDSERSRFGDRGLPPSGDNWTPDQRRARVYSSKDTANSGLVAQKKNGVKAYIKKVM